MPAILNWILRLILTNPICMRLATTGSKRTRHLLIRSGYLGLLIVTMLFLLLTQTGQGSLSMRRMAQAGTTVFQWVAYLQLTLICLLTPIFMAGAIAQEANPRTWEILLTTPLNSLQIVLGNLFGRLFFVLALLFSSLPLFAIVQYFGGMPGQSIFLSYLISGCAALVVGAVAIALSVSRQAGRRAVFLFYITVVIYLGITWSLDLAWGTQGLVSWVTPLNPFLVLQVLLDRANYAPISDAELVGAGFFAKLWFGSPVAAFCWLYCAVSLFLIAWSTLFLRIIGERTGQASWLRRLLGLESSGSQERNAREVWHNPVAWREAAGKRNTIGSIIARWGFIALGMLIAIAVIACYHFGVITSVDALRRTALTVLATEVAIITLAAVNISATAISREREDGTLDILLTTPITPSYYVTGKLKGLVRFLLPFIAVPVFTAFLFSLYYWFDGLGNTKGVDATYNFGSGPVNFPFILPEAMIVLPLVLVSFVSFAVMIGLNWSLKSKGTIGSVVAAVGVIGVVVGVLSLCGIAAGGNAQILGPVLVNLSPGTSVFALIFPEMIIEDAMDGGTNAIRSARIALIFGAGIAAAGYWAVVYGVHQAMLGPNGRSFDMTVRRLAGVR